MPGTLKNAKKKVFLGSLKTTAGHEAVGSGSKAKQLQGWDRLGDGTAFHARMLSAPRGREKEAKKKTTETQRSGIPTTEVLKAGLEATQPFTPSSAPCSD